MKERAFAESEGKPIFTGFHVPYHIVEWVADRPWMYSP